MNQPRISVIMPCYNVGSTLERAIHSILMQKVSCKFEIIAINDASTDNTLAILETLASEHPQIRVLNNEENLGNAGTFYKGLCSSQGDFFCVLDGDDYYTIPDKFQKQIDFFDKDTDEAFVATCHHFIYDLDNGKLNITDCSRIKEYSFVDFLYQFQGAYYHTSSFMYRNIFRGRVPEYYKYAVYRGDTPRTLFHLKYSNRKVAVLNFVGSAYSITTNGIWTSMAEKKQFEYQINYLTTLRKTLKTPLEIGAIDRLIDKNSERRDTASDKKLREYAGISLDTLLEHIDQQAHAFAFNHFEYMCQGTFYSQYLDSACVSLGEIYRLRHPETVQTQVDNHHIAIVVPRLNPKGGGIFREVTELFSMHADQKIMVLVTGMDTLIDEITEQWKDYENVEKIVCCAGQPSRLEALNIAMRDFAPYRTYFYCSHNDSYCIALMQGNAGENVCLFSFDHGFLLGLTNPYLDTIIAKRPADYAFIQKRFPDKALYIPTWNITASHSRDMVYSPFRDHEKLITASGAARYYKVDGGWPYDYWDFILGLLQKTGGKHYHYGPVPGVLLKRFRQRLRNEGIADGSFVYSPWADDFAGDLLKNNVDIFIEPFPIVSYKMTLDVLSAGIPVIAREGYKRLEMTDFIYDDALKWNSQDDFVEILAGLTSEDLRYHAQKSLHYFATHHAFETIRPYILDLKSFPLPPHVQATDDILSDIVNHQFFFQWKPPIRLMNQKPVYIKFSDPQKAAVAKKVKLPPDVSSGVQQKTNPPSSEGNVYAEIHSIQTSASYRVGYIVLWVPHFVKVYCKTILKHGIIGAGKIALNAKSIKPKFPYAPDQLSYLKECSSYRFGLSLTAPVRFLKRKLISK